MFPQYFLSLSSHGNSCAGVIAGVANNSRCGVGLAYNAKIAGNCLLVFISIYKLCIIR